MTIDYEKLKVLCESYGIKVLESTYLGHGILGRFFPPDIILIDCELCDACNLEKQKRVLVLLHEMCHWFKWQEHKDNPGQSDEEACFEFEMICNEILNNDCSVDDDFEAVQRLGLTEPMKFLKQIMEM